MKIEVNPELVHKLMEFYKLHMGRVPQSDAELMYSVYMLFQYYDGERKKKK